MGLEWNGEWEMSWSCTTQYDKDNEALEGEESPTSSRGKEKRKHKWRGSTCCDDVVSFLLFQFT